MRRRWLGLLFVATGCWSPVTDLVTSHVEPGGSLAATLNGSAPLTTKAVADASVDPMTLDGNSAELVVGLVVGTDELTGMPGKTQLLAGAAVTLTVSATSTTQLSVHLGGSSCAATAATIHLTPDGNGHLNGDFAGSGAGCQTSGTLSAIPVYQGS